MAPVAHAAGCSPGCRRQSTGKFPVKPAHRKTKPASGNEEQHVHNSGNGTEAACLTRAPCFQVPREEAIKGIEPDHCACNGRQPQGKGRSQETSAVCPCHVNPVFASLRVFANRVLGLCSRRRLTCFV